MSQKNPLQISLVQPAISWENISENLENYARTIDTIDHGLVILPELFNTGFSMNTERLAEDMDGPTVAWMRAITNRKNIALAGSIMIKEKNVVYNRFIVVSEGRVISVYDKRHLFRMGKEHMSYGQGVRQGDFEYQGWKIRPLICYDLRFPVWSRNNTGYDLLIYVANWPGVRQRIWQTLLEARAIENQCYVAGVNCVGVDGNDISYLGGSIIFNARGEIQASAKDKPEIITEMLDYDALVTFREKFPVYLDSDKFKIE